MTPRHLARTRRMGGWALAAALLLTLAGCDPRTLIYFLQPFEPTIPPDCTAKLKGKRVVILVHDSSSARADFPTLENDLTRSLAIILREKIKKVDIVEPEKIRVWAQDHPTYTAPAEAGEAFDADAVIFMEVEQFQITDPNSPSLYQGIAKIHVQLIERKHPTDSRGKPLTDKPKEAEVVYDTYRDTEFPNRGPLPMDVGVSRGAFKAHFIKLVATQLSWHFVERAHGDDIQSVKFN